MRYAMPLSQKRCRVTAGKETVSKGIIYACLLFIFVLIALGIAVLPVFASSKRWGCVPSIFVYVAMVVVLMLAITDVI
jgi:membrane protein YdbS with pleckstrin-like domain